MRRLFCSAAVTAMALSALTGCSGTSNESICDEIERAVSKSVIVASDTILGTISVTTTKAAGDEIEGYLEPLRELTPQGDLAEPTEAVLEQMDELVVAIRAGSAERISTVASELGKALVDVQLACD